MVIKVNKLFCTLVSVLLTSLLLSACGSGTEGPKTQTNQDTSQNSGDDFTYKGPAAVSDGVQRYKEYLWDNIRQEDRCGGCHSVAGGNSFKFARVDDINAAYREVASYINLNSAKDSALVEKLKAGHSCWESQSSVCADLLTSWIDNWASIESAQVNVVELRAPVNKAPAQTKSFPSDSSTFESLIYTPYLKPHCSGCHRSNVANAQSPFFASDDIEQAYLAAMNKINLESSDISRLVVRLKDESHNCWSDCANNSADLLALPLFIEREIEGFTLFELACKYGNYDAANYLII